jgi:dolichol-phosphate mannosyltransferase
LKSIVIIPVFREIGRIGSVLSKFEPSSIDQICLVIDDPIPAILQEIDEARKTIKIPVEIIQNPVRKGIGYAIRQGYSYALSHGYELVVVMAGNGKDDPREISRLTTPILKQGFDYVQGSRYVRGGRHDKNPFLRSAFVRMFPVVWTALTGVRCSDVTNGYRAYKASLLKDPRVNINQDWLDRYELEYYLHYKALTLGYRFTEKPVSKTYPFRNKGGYSHISPMRDWWQIVGPLFLLKMGAKD